MTQPDDGPDRALTRRYAELVSRGVYSASSGHPDWAIRFFGETMSGPLAELAARRPLRILECGVGTGFWLGHVHELVARDPEVVLHGFDLTPEMASEARVRFEVEGIPATAATGDILTEEAYAGGDRGKHDIVFCYDVVQQLPKEHQVQSVLTMFEHVAPGGWLVIFDNDARSRFGRVMGAKKWLRRHLGIPLVPAFYIHARYPALAPLARRLTTAGGEAARIAVEEQGRHRALLARRPGPRSPGPT